MTGDRSLSGQVAVITGGSRGIGLVMARAFAGLGANIVIASRKLDACTAACLEIEEEFAVETMPFAMNVSDWEQCDALVDASYQRFGHVDILVNNAGLSPLYDSLTTVDSALFDKVIAVNLRGPFRLMALVGERMVAGGGGSIVNIGSSAAIRPDPMALPYSAAKAGLHTLTEGFAQALAPTVRVNTVQPGPILTDIAANWREGHEERLSEMVALGRCGTPEEVVGAVVYMATSGSSYTTGAVLRVDGGWR